MPVLSQSHSIIIYRGISAPGHGKELVDGPNDIDKRYMYKLLSNVQLTVSITFDSQIIMNYCAPKNDASMAKELLKHLSKDHS